MTGLAIGADVVEALAASPAAMAAFDRLPPSHKSEYLRWIDEAKRPETRRRRMSGMIERLLAGADER